MAERILMIEDDAEMSAMVAAYLDRYGMRVESAATGAAGLKALARGPFDAVLLDLMLPDADGLELCRQIRQDPALGGVDTPIVMLTARGDDADRIVGLALGADDYVPKPFNPRELLARLRAVMRRAARGGEEARDGRLRFGALVIDPDARVVSVDGEERALTSRQFDLLLALARRPGRVLSRDQLMTLVQDRALEAFDRSIDVHISRIRAAIEDDPDHPRRIVTVRGVGYVFAREAAG